MLEGVERQVELEKRQWLAQEVIEQAVADAGSADSPTARNEIMEFLSWTDNPWYSIQGVCDEAIKRIAESVPDTTLPWYD